MVSQMTIFERACKMSIQLPIVKDELDYWYCGNRVNAAILELEHHGKGPVHINVPIEQGLNAFNTRALPVVNKIRKF